MSVLSAAADVVVILLGLGLGLGLCVGHLLRHYVRAGGGIAAAPAAGESRPYAGDGAQHLEQPAESAPVADTGPTPADIAHELARTHWAREAAYRGRGQWRPDIRLRAVLPLLARRCPDMDEAHLTSLAESALALTQPEEAPCPHP